MTDAVEACLDDSMRRLCTPMTHIFEDIGETSTHYIDLAALRVPAAQPEESFLRRLGATVKFELSTLPFVFRMREPAEGFRNLGRGREELSA